MAFFGTPAGGFFVFGCLIALVTAVTKGKAPVKKSFDCEGCPSASLCHASYKCIEMELAAVPGTGNGGCSRSGREGGTK